MADEKKEESKKFLRVTWQQVVSAVVVAVFLGIFGWMGATIKAGLEDLEELKEWRTATEAVMTTDLAHTLEDLDESIKGNSSKMGAMGGEIRRLEILVNRLDAIVERINGE
jgi:hypothetical protein